MIGEEFLKKADVQKIAREGAAIYERIKTQYDPEKKGKFLAIEIDSKDVYIGNTSAEALVLAREQHPDKIFYVVKVGFETAETVAESFTHGYAW